MRAQCSSVTQPASERACVSCEHAEAEADSAVPGTTQWAIEESKQLLAQLKQENKDLKAVGAHGI